MGECSFLVAGFLRKIRDISPELTCRERARIANESLRMSADYYTAGFADGYQACQDEFHGEEDDDE